MRHQYPLVSIIVPCYYAERFVGDAIRSALAQTWANKEVIVNADGSMNAGGIPVEAPGR